MSVRVVERPAWRSKKTGRDPGRTYEKLAKALGRPFSDRVEAAASAEQKQGLAALSPDSLGATELAGEPIAHVLVRAPGNGAAIGGIKVIAANGWFAVRPSGTEDIYKIYAESFASAEHLQLLLTGGQAVVDRAITAPAMPGA